MPWASYELDDRGLVIRDENNMPKLTGYCVEVRLEISNKFYIVSRKTVYVSYRFLMNRGK